MKCGSGLEPELRSCFGEYEASRLREGEATRIDIERQLERISRVRSPRCVLGFPKSNAPFVPSSLSASAR